MASTSLLLPLVCIFGKSNAFNHQRVHKINAGALATEPRLQVSNVIDRQDDCAVMNRRNLINAGVALLGLLSSTTLAEAAGLPPEEKPKLCDNACEKELQNVPMVTTESGLQYKDIQIGAGPSPPIGFQVIKGLDEGILSMKVGGKRRLYIPGPLAFPKGLTSAPGRPRVAANSPVIFDVSLLFIPGLDDEE